MKVVDGFGPDGPKMRAPRVNATLRHLATHTSGLAYEFWNADMPKYLEMTQHPSILSGLNVSLKYPLMFDPGERWAYGMGHALYSTAPDYMRFLRMFLNKGTLEGARILSEASVQTMLQNHIGSTPIPYLTSTAPPLTADVDFFPGKRKSHSLGFMRFDEDIPGMRRAGSQGWAGVLNSHYWFDPKSNLAGVLMTQSLPFIEPRYAATYEAFERAAYRALAA